MTSPIPLLYDTYYHIYNRGNNHTNIFIQERNFSHFMYLYGKFIEPIAETFAYCLLRNHFHVLVRIKSKEEIFPDEDACKKLLSKKKTSRSSIEYYPSQKFSNLFNSYAKAINSAYGRTGALFQHPFGRVPVTSENQFWNVIAYIHQNPQKHQFVKDFREWKWSSYGVILTEKPTKLKRKAVLDWFGGIQNYQQIHGQWISDAVSSSFAEDDCD